MNRFPTAEERWPRQGEVINMNIYHRFINVPVDIPKPKVFEKTPESFITYVGEEAVPSKFKEWINSFGLTLSNIVEGFYSGPNGGEVPIHNDTTTKPGEHDAIKINMTWGPATSVIRWWKVKNESDLVEVVHDQTEINDGFTKAGITPDIECHKCYTAESECVEKVHEVVINSPSIINVGQLHSTYNPDPNGHRWTLSFTPLKDGKIITFNNALKIFESCLKE